jgi:cytochrome c oxidase assembly protein subunit 11
MKALALAHRRVARRLLLAAAAAFAFGFALVPLYDTFCRLTGLNGRTALTPSTADRSRDGVDRARTIGVEFTGTTMPGLPWELRPLQRRVELHPGELQTAHFLVRNLSDRPLAGQAVPSVSPGQAARHFDKLDCFCFTVQTLAPGESRELPVVFLVRRGIAAEIGTITLAYAFYPVADAAAR